jgi:hypothetical protein
MGFYEHRYIKIRFGICYNFIRTTLSNPKWKSAINLVPKMERLKELISLLEAQFDRKADPAQMLQTTQLLEAELRLLASQPAPARVMPTKIAVMMPSAAKIVDLPAAPSPASAPVPPAAVTNPGATVVAPAAAANPATVSAAAVSTAATVVAPTSVASPAAVAVPANPRTPERGTWPFDPLAEKPTDRFTLSQKSREINDVIGTGNGNSSLNDKLKSDVVELKSALNDTPVRDLKKAIGINDRYVFINQLFRGDEVMYERSLKTINGFRILPEAEYWMERELKVKLGWDENREATRHFYQLVKRRFS